MAMRRATSPTSPGRPTPSEQPIVGAIQSPQQVVNRHTADATVAGQQPGLRRSAAPPGCRSQSSVSRRINSRYSAVRRRRSRRHARPTRRQARGAGLDSDPSTPRLLGRSRPGRPARTRRSDSAQRSAGSRPTARRTAHRRAAENLPSMTLCWKQRWLPRPSPTGTSAAISSQLGIPTVQVCRALRTSTTVNIDPRQAAEQPASSAVNAESVKILVSRGGRPRPPPRPASPTRPPPGATRTGPNRR